MVEDIRNLRVSEPWPLIDVLRIKNSFPQATQDEGFQSYKAMAAADTVSLFSAKRRRTSVGEAFSSMDLDGQLSYGVLISSMGIGFKAPCVVPASQVTQEMDAYEPLLFEVEIPRLTGARLIINQDEKLINRVELMPEGVGLGGAMQISGSPGLTVIATLQNGVPILGAQWPFPKPLAVPRGSTFSLELRFSQEARELLRAMNGPGYWPFFNPDGTPYTPAVAKVAMIVGVAVVERDAQLREGYNAATM